MTPRVRRALLAGMLGLAAGIVLAVLHRPGVTVEGQSFQRWFTAARRQPADLRWTLARIGPAALPELAGLRDWEEPAWNPWIRTEASRLPRPLAGWLTRLARRPEADVRSDVLYGIRLFGEEARAELPWLLGRAGDRQDPGWDHALTAILDIAPEDAEVRGLTARLLGDPDPGIRRRAARSLQTARARLPELAEALRPLLAEDAVTVEVTLLALARIGPAAASAAPAVAQRLGDPLHGRTAERTLAVLGTDAVVPLLPGIYRMLLTNLPPPFLVLATAGTNATPARALLEAYRADPDALVRLQAAWAAGAVQGDPSIAAAGLAAVLRDRGAASDSGFLPRAEPFDSEGGLFSLTPRQAAAWFLGELGPGAAPARSALEAALADDDLHLALLAARALLHQGVRVDAVAHVLRAGLGAEDPYARRLACVIARDVGPAARLLRPSLEAATATDMITRRFAREALGATGR